MVLCFDDILVIVISLELCVVINFDLQYILYVFIFRWEKYQVFGKVIFGIRLIIFKVSLKIVSGFLYENNMNVKEIKLYFVFIDNYI